MAQQQVVVANPVARNALDLLNPQPGATADVQFAAMSRKRKLSEVFNDDGGVVSAIEHRQAVAAEATALNDAMVQAGGAAVAPPWFGPAIALVEARLATRIDNVAARIDNVAARIDKAEARTAAQIHNLSTRLLNKSNSSDQPLRPLKQPSTNRLPNEADNTTFGPHDPVFPATKNDIDALTTHDQCDALLAFYELHVPPNSTVNEKRRHLKAFIHAYK
mmetsp:Transcript_14136/g.46144  ORF Transcript_14136/g.46144 Transcript_14136/m.46144 type:complete len:219 (+) Transcript_14136:52-708(+)